MLIVSPLLRLRHGICTGRPALAGLDEATGDSGEKGTPPDLLLVAMALALFAAVMSLSMPEHLAPRFLSRFGARTPAPLLLEPLDRALRVRLSILFVLARLSVRCKEAGAVDDLTTGVISDDFGSELTNGHPAPSSSATAAANANDARVFRNGAWSYVGNIGGGEGKNSSLGGRVIVALVLTIAGRVRAGRGEAEELRIGSVASCRGAPVRSEVGDCLRRRADD